MGGYKTDSWHSGLLPDNKDRKRRQPLLQAEILNWLQKAAYSCPRYSTGSTHHLVGQYLAVPCGDG